MKIRDLVESFEARNGSRRKQVTAVPAASGPTRSPSEALEAQLSTMIGGKWQLHNIGHCHRAIVELLECNQALLEAVSQLDANRETLGAGGVRATHRSPSAAIPQPQAGDLAALRQQMLKETDPAVKAQLARRCRDLRGHSGLFETPQAEPEGDLGTLRAQIEKETDPTLKAALARRCRILRGHEGLFDPQPS